MLYSKEIKEDLIEFEEKTKRIYDEIKEALEKRDGLSDIYIDSIKNFEDKDDPAKSGIIIYYTDLHNTFPDSSHFDTFITYNEYSTYKFGFDNKLRK